MQLPVTTTKWWTENIGIHLQTQLLYIQRQTLPTSTKALQWAPEWHLFVQSLFVASLEKEILDTAPELIKPLFWYWQHIHDLATQQHNNSPPSYTYQLLSPHSSPATFNQKYKLRQEKRNPTFSIAMCIYVDGSFHEVIRLKTNVATYQPRFHAHTQTEVSLAEKPENSDVKHQANHSKRCKGDARRILNLSLGSPNRNTSYLRKLVHAHSVFPLKNSGRLGNSGATGKLKRCISYVQRKLQVL